MKFTSFLEFSCTLNIWTIEIRCLRVQAIMLPQLLSRGKKKRKKKVRKGVTRPIIRLEVHTTSNFPLETKKMLISLMGKDKTKWTSVFFFFFFSVFLGGGIGGCWGQLRISSKYQNLKSGSTSIAQANFARRDLLNICEVREM